MKKQSNEQRRPPHKINISLHPEVIAHVYINVARTSDEAKLQESGQSIQDKDRVEEKEAQVEIEKLFDDIGMAASIEEDPENAAQDSKLEEIPESKA